MDEAQDRTRLSLGPESLAILRHVKPNTMQKERSKGYSRERFKQAGWHYAFLSKTPGPILKCDCAGWPRVKASTTPPFPSAALTSPPYIAS